MVFIYIRQEDIAKNPQSTRSPSQCKSSPGNNLVSRRNHLLYHYSITIHLHHASFYADKLLLKKISKGNVIEQIIEFKLREPGPPSRICTSTTGYFHNKTKIYTENFCVDHYLLLNHCRRQCTLLPPTWAKSLKNFYPKCKILSVFWT